MQRRSATNKKKNKEDTFFSVRYIEAEIDSVRKIHKLTNPHCDSPSEGIFARELSLRTPKPE